MSEVWKDIIGFEGRYQVSDFGRVKSILKNKVLSPNNNGKGYLSVQLGTNCRRYIHRLVAQAFIKNCSCEVNHKDMDKSNNKLSNLEYVTRSDNQRHMIVNGRHNRAKLTAYDRAAIKKLIGSGLRQKDIAIRFNVSKSTISSIVRNKTWAWGG